MQDRPSAIELLDAARDFLESEVIPALEGRKQFHARVAANVLAIVGRELALESGHLEAEWRRLDELLGEAPFPADRGALGKAIGARTEALCESIRRGEADAGERRRAVFDHVRRTVREKLAIANPKLLGAAEGT